MGLMLGIYASRYGEMLLDATPFVTDLRTTTRPRGFGQLSARLRLSLAESFRLYDRPGLPHVVLTWNGITVWEGRLEDVAIVDGGVRLGAFGYHRALSDTLYTGAFTSTDSGTIAAAIVADVAATNSTQLSTSTAQVSTTSISLSEIYEDMRPADILTRLAALGDTSGNTWEWGVWENLLLFFRARGAVSRAWYVDATSLELERSLDRLYNSAYGIYTAGTNTRLATAVSTNSASVSRYGITREWAVRSDYADTTAAAYSRDTFIAENKDATPRARITFDEVYDGAGVRWPLFLVRAGDTITIRNLPPTVSTSVDKVRTFYLDEAEYDSVANTLTVQPSAYTPTLDRQIAALRGDSRVDLPRIYGARQSLAAPFLELPGLRAFWPISSRDSSGNSNDISGQGRTLTDVSTGYGIYNSLVPYLDLGGAAYQSRTSEAGLVITASLTFCAWVYFTNAAGTLETIAAKRQVAAQIDWHLYRETSGVLKFGLSSDGSTFAMTVSSVAAMAADGWHFVVARKNSSTEAAVILDGVKASTAASVPASLFGGTAKFTVASIDSAANYMTGRMALAALCAAAVSDDQLTAIYQATRGAFGV